MKLSQTQEILIERLQEHGSLLASNKDRSLCALQRLDLVRYYPYGKDADGFEGIWKLTQKGKSISFA